MGDRQYHPSRSFILFLHRFKFNLTVDTSLPHTLPLVMHTSKSPTPFLNCWVVPMLPAIEKAAEVPGSYETIDSASRLVRRSCETSPILILPLSIPQHHNLESLSKLAEIRKPFLFIHNLYGYLSLASNIEKYSLWEIPVKWGSISMTPIYISDRSIQVIKVSLPCCIGSAGGYRAQVRAQVQFMPVMGSIGIACMHIMPPFRLQHLPDIITKTTAGICMSPDLCFI